MILKHGLLGLALVGSLVVLAAPVVADPGWLLLVPPKSPGSQGGQSTYDFKASLDQWKQKKAYDSATECENDKVRLKINAADYMVPPPRRWWDPLDRPEHDEENLSALEATHRYLRQVHKEDVRKMTPEQKAQWRAEREAEWSKEMEAWRQRARMYEAEAQPLVNLLDLTKCVPAEAVYGLGVKRQP